MQSQDETAPTSTPDREELDERTECFECGAVIAPPATRGLAVTEGIVLCESCCVRRGGQYDPSREVWAMAPWFDDLTGVDHQADTRKVCAATPDVRRRSQ